MTQSPSRFALLLVALTLAACGARTPFDDQPDVLRADGAGGPDATDVGGLIDTGDAGDTVNIRDASPVEERAPSPDVPPVGCRADFDCGGMTPRCRQDIRQCVACLTPDDCPRGATCRDFACVGSCGGGACASGQTCCGDVCVDEGSSAANCGGCGVRCAAGQGCVGGVCTAATTCPTVPCGPGQACCAGACRAVQNDPANCGGCDVRCSGSTPVCMGVACCAPGPGGVCGARVCPPGQTLCGADCLDLTSDLENCGGCATPCRVGANAGALCRAGQCRLTCRPGFADCDGVVANGCETALDSATNCGTCGRACPTGSACVRGACSARGCNGGRDCTAGQTCCTTGCADVSTDPTHCGRCGQACRFANATSVCAAGACAIGACAAGFGNCDGNAANGCEASLQGDSAHCGLCGRACAAGLACTNGACQRASDGSEGAFVPTANPTYLSPGVHQFTTITVPAGAVVFVAGAGPQAGTLDLRATGHIQVDGTIDVSGGPGSQAVVASRTTQQGHAGTGGYTGEVRSAAMATTSCEFDTGATGPNGPAVMGAAGSCPVVASTECLSRGDDRVFIFTAAPAQFGGGAGVFSGYRAYGSGGGGYAGGGGGALGATFPGERDCAGVTAGGGAASGQGGRAMSVTAYDGANGTLGQTQCDATMGGIPRAWVGGGAGGSIGSAAAADLAVTSTFRAGSGGGGGSADYLQRPAFGGTSGGGGGGGALRLWTGADIVVNGRLLAVGGAGGDAYLGTPASAGCDPQPGAAGGGGSGGLIYLVAPSITTGATALVSAAGGRGGDASVFATGGGGGAGGLGRIRISVSSTTCSLGGTLTPAPVAGCAPAPATPGRAYVAAYPN